MTEELIPTDGSTACPVIDGDFRNTYDGNPYSECWFATNLTCLSEWTWADPIHVVGFWLFTINYNVINYIYNIWGRVDGSWNLLWNGSHHMPNNRFDHITFIDCNNCTGIRIAQDHPDSVLNPSINSVIIEYEPPGASGSIDFREQSAQVGDRIHADCIWNNAQLNSEYGYYAGMWLIDPDGINRDSNHAQNPSGSTTLGYPTDKAGIWRAELDVWDGIQWLIYETQVFVEQPPPPPECSPEGARECFGADLYECQAGQWVLIESNSPQCQQPVECESYTSQSECEVAGCYWYPFPNPFGEPSCHSNTIIKAYLPIAILGVGAVVTLVAIIAKR